MTLLVVQAVQLDHAPVVVVMRFNLCWPQAFFFIAVDKIGDVTWRKFFVVNIRQLEHAFDRCQLILRIENLKTLRQTGVTMMGSQQAVAESVKGTDPHAAQADRQHGAKPRQHFLGRLVGEGNRNNGQWADLTG